MMHAKYGGLHDLGGELILYAVQPAKPATLLVACAVNVGWVKEA